MKGQDRKNERTNQKIEMKYNTGPRYILRMESLSLLNESGVCSALGLMLCDELILVNCLGGSVGDWGDSHL